MRSHSPKCLEVGSGLHDFSFVGPRRSGYPARVTSGYLRFDALVRIARRCVVRPLTPRKRIRSRLGWVVFADRRVASERACLKLLVGVRRARRPIGGISDPIRHEYPLVLEELLMAKVCIWPCAAEWDRTIPRVPRQRRRPALSGGPLAYQSSTEMLLNCHL